MKQISDFEAFEQSDLITKWIYLFRVAKLYLGHDHWIWSSCSRRHHDESVLGKDHPETESQMIVRLFLVKGLSTVKGQFISVSLWAHPKMLHFFHNAWLLRQVIKLLWICNCINFFSRNFNNVFVFILILLSYRSAKLENLQKSFKKVKFIILHYETKPSVIQE